MAIEKVSRVNETGNKKGELVKIESGSNVGLFAGIVHLGLQRSEYQGKVSFKEKVLLRFELPDVVMEDGRPIVLSKTETFNLSSYKGKESNLLKVSRILTQSVDLKEGINWEEVLGRGVLLELKKSETTAFTNIVGYSSLPKSLSQSLKPLVDDGLLVFDVDTINDNEMNRLPQWVQKMINTRQRSGNDNLTVDF